MIKSPSTIPHHVPALPTASAPPAGLPVGKGGAVSEDALRALLGKRETPPDQLDDMPRPRSTISRETLDKTIPQPGATAAAGSPGSVRAGGSEVKQVVVLDWDDCLRDHQALNYQWLHNALALAAEEKADTLPEIGVALERLRRGMKDGVGADDDAPLLMKSQEDFSKHLLVHHKIFTLPVTEDFVRKMLPDLDEQRTESIIHAVHARYVRQMKARIRPPGDHEQPPAKPEPPRNLPFPEVPFTMMPGAQAFLEKCRSPDTRVILLSNRQQGDLENEIRHLGKGHHFDVVSGSPRVTQKISDAPPEPMPVELQQKLMGLLGGTDTEALRTALEEAAVYAHPDTTKVRWTPTKPDPTRLRESLEALGVPPDVPIVSYGDQVTDVQQLARLDQPDRRLEGVIVNRTHPKVGHQIDVEGIPTRVVSSFEDLVAEPLMKPLGPA